MRRQLGLSERRSVAQNGRRPRNSPEDKPIDTSESRGAGDPEYPPPNRKPFCICVVFRGSDAALLTECYVEISCPRFSMAFESRSAPSSSLPAQNMNFFNPIKTHSTLFATGAAMLLLAGAATAPAQAAGYSKVSSGMYNGKTYEVWKKDMGTLTWTDAKNYAISTLGAPLVSFNTQAENNFVATLIQDASLYTAATSPPAVANNYVGPYIGLQRLGNSGPNVGWQWLDGTPLALSDALWANWYAPAMQPDAMDGDNVGLFYNGSNGTLYPTGGMAGFPSSWGDVFDGATLAGGGANPYLANSFVIEKVPGPLPVLGALAAFRMSRRLRRRSSVAVRSI